MSNLVVISGDFCSGSTLLFTLFRKARKFYCLYEPLHDKLLEYLIWPLRVYEHHFFVENYFAEYKGFHEIPKLFNPRWAVSGLHLAPAAQADELYRYFSYLIGAAYGRSPMVLLKENRLTFRLGWFRARFPQAKVIHIYRDRDYQWKSMVRRVQAALGRENVGQDEVTFQGFNIATWCEDLQGTFPQLRAQNSHSGYDRFCKLWELSHAEQQRYADLSIDYSVLTHEFEATCVRIQESIGCDADMTALKRFVVPPEQHTALPVRRPRWRLQIGDLLDRAGRRYAKIRVQGLMRARGL